MFVRFVVSDRDEQSGELRGVFAALYRLQADGMLSAAESAWFAGAESWFNQHLKAPDAFGLSDRPNAPKKAITWLKASAVEHVRRMRELVALLDHKDVIVHELKTDRPGYVVYEDQHQVAAVPLVRRRSEPSSVLSNVELNLTGGLRQQLARIARELHLVGSAGRLTPAR